MMRLGSAFSLLVVFHLLACAAPSDDPMGGPGELPGVAGDTPETPMDSFPETKAPVEAPWEPRWAPLQQTLPAFEIRFPQSTADIVYDPAHYGEYAPGFFTANGTTYDVQLRKRGQAAWFHPKSSWKVELPAGTTFEGARRFNFMAEYVDSGYLTDIFSYRLFQAAGVKAPDARYVLLKVNGTFEGVYTQVEAVDKFFLRHHGLDPDSNIYRCGSRDCELKLTPPAHYQNPFEKKTNETEPWTDLEQFLQAISRTPESEFEAFAERHLYLENHLRYMAVNALISNAGIDDSGSYLVHDAGTDKWLLIPWDLNNGKMVFWRDLPADADANPRLPIPTFTAYDTTTIGTYEWKEAKYGGAHRPWSVLNQRIWDRPRFRERILKYIQSYLSTIFVEATAHAQVDGLRAIVANDLPRDPWILEENCANAPGFLKRYITRRREKLSTFIPEEQVRGTRGVVINGYSLGGTLRDERGDADPFIELYNREDTAIDIGGRVFTDNLRDEFRYYLPQGLSVPAHGKLILWADGEPAEGPTHLPFRLAAQGGEFGLLTGEMAGVVDLVFYGPLRAGQTYARSPDGAEEWSWR